MLNYIVNIFLCYQKYLEFGFVCLFVFEWLGKFEKLPAMVAVPPLIRAICLHRRTPLALIFVQEITSHTKSSTPTLNNSSFIKMSPNCLIVHCIQPETNNALEDQSASLANFQQ